MYFGKSIQISLILTVFKKEQSSAAAAAQLFASTPGARQVDKEKRKLQKICMMSLQNY